MERSLLGVALIAMMMATGCSNEELVQNPSSGNHEFTLTMNMGAQSRTVMKDGTCVWNVGDAIYVFNNEQTIYGVLKIENASDITNDGRTAKFKGFVNGEGTLNHVAYPANQYLDRNAEIPAPADFKIEMRDVEGADHNAPMYGTIGNGNTMNYLGGLVKFQITGLEHKEVVFNAKMNNVDITGGYYKFENGNLQHFVSDVKTTTIHNIPEDGVIYLPVAVSQKAGAGQAAPKATVTAYAQENPGNVIGDIIGGAGGENLEIPVSNGDISTNDVPNYDVSGDDAKESKWINDDSELAAAFTDNNSGSYKLKAGKTFTGTYTLNNAAKELTIDLNGSTVECADDDVFRVEAGTLILQGNGTVYGAKNGQSTGCAVWVCGEDPSEATAIIKGGSYMVGDDERESSISGRSSRNDCIYLGSTAAEKLSCGGQIFIEGGTFRYAGGEANDEIKTNDGHNFLVNQANQINSKCIFISGGKFYKFDPANAFTDDIWMYVDGVNKPGSYLEDGFGVFRNEETGYFEVIEK